MNIQSEIILAIIIIMLILICAAFYWWEWRPSQIIKKCSSNPLQSDIDVTGGNLNQSQYEEAYKICIKLNGLEK